MAAALLLVPAIAMRFSSEVTWGPGDFLVAAVILGAVGAGLELAARLKGRARLAVAALTLFAGLAVWAELAVGIFD